MKLLKYKLRDLIVIKNGKDHQNLNEGNIPVYGSGGIMRYVDSYLYDGQSILLPRKGSLDNIQYAQGKFWTVDTCYYTEVKQKLVVPFFLYNYIKLLDLSNLNTGTGVPSMTFDSYYNLTINLPNLLIQQRIVAVLSALDNKIALNRRINAKLEQMAKRLYDYWFVQFDFPNAEGKPYKSSGGKMVYNATLKREIPEGWEVSNLKKCIENINTGLNPRDNFVLGNGDIKYVTVKNLTESGILDFSNCDLIDEKARALVHNRSDINLGDILYASICPLGRCHLINAKPVKWDINESVFSLRPNRKFVSSPFLYFILRDEYYVKRMSQVATGSIFKGIRINDIEKTVILIPSKPLIDLFTEKVCSTINMQTNLQKEIEQLTALRDKLLPLLMNGQIVVKE